MLGSNFLLVEERAARAVAEAAERRFSDLLHGLDAVVWEGDAATLRFTFVNRRAEDLLGYPVERWLATAEFWHSLIDPRDRQRVLARYAEVVDGGGRLDHEFRAIAADGRVVWLRDRVHRTPDGRLRGLMIDVTERKRLEQERDDLLMREQVARAEVEATAEMVQRLESVTETALAHLSLPDLLRDVLDRIRAVVQADATVILLPGDDGTHLDLAGAVGVVAGRPGLRIAVGEGVTGRIAAERRPVVIDDSAHAELDVPVLREARVRTLIGIPLTVDGRLVGVVYAARRRRRFRAEDTRLLQLVGDRVAVAIRNATLYESERRARRMTEASERRAAFLADATTALFDSRDAASALLAVARLSVPAIADACVMDLRERDGTYRRVALCRPDHDEEVRVTRGRFAPPDGDGALARALRTGVVQWAASGGSVADLAAGTDTADGALDALAIDGYVCAPLVAGRRTLGAISLVRGPQSVRLREDDVALVQELARRAALAVDDGRRRRETRETLRLFARLMSGRVQIERQPLDLVDVTHDALAVVAEEARGKGVHVHAQLDTTTLPVSGDRRRLGQVMRRLLEAAIRATPTGGRVVTRLARDGARAMLALTGAGGGTDGGVRLAIAHRLIELHGGTVSTARDNGRTTTVTIALPLSA